MSYRIIRVSADRSIALVVMPFDAPPWSEGCRFFLRDPQFVSEVEAFDFKKVEKNVAREYCEKMDRETAPEEHFSSLEEVSHWLSQKPSAHASRAMR